jgi:hypothetical protein
MSRRIEIEITSLNGDVATWRAAGAKLPKGTLDVSLVPGGAVVGSVYRADIEQYMERIDVVAVLPPKTASPLDPKNERLTLLVPEAKGPEITVTYAPKGRGPRRDDDREGRGSSRPGGRGPKRDGDAPRGDRPPRGPKPEGATEGARAERPARPRREGAGDGARGPRRDGAARGGRPNGPVDPVVTTTHRNAMLATLSPEQLPVAEQLLRGGMPSVRAAVAEQNKNATAQGRPTIDPATIERIAEDLLGKTTLAMWKDRAAGALTMGKELRLRDLRAIVTAAKTVSLDDEGRTQLKGLQASLTTRLELLRTQWTERLDAAVASNNVAEALRLVARPPDMSTRVSSETAAKVTAMVSEALHEAQEVAVWVELVNLAVETSIRRNIKPTGIPADEAAKALAIKNAGAIPEFAKLLGMKVPPPPPPSRTPSRPARPARPARRN